MNRFLTWLYVPEDSHLLPTELPFKEMIQVYARRLAWCIIPGLPFLGIWLGYECLCFLARWSSPGF